MPFFSIGKNKKIFFEKSVDNIILLWYYTYREKHISDGQRAVGNIEATENALVS